MGTSDITEWGLDSITRRDVRISDTIIALLEKWNSAYLSASGAITEDNKPTKEDLARIEEFKKKGWI